MTFSAHRRFVLWQKNGGQKNTKRKSVFIFLPLIFLPSIFPGAPLALIPALILAFLISIAAPARAADDIVPEDSCVLELDLPAGATVTIDGRDYGTKRKMTFGSLARGRLYPSKLRIAFPGGTTDERELLIHGGWRIPLRIAPRDPSAPELVPQTGQPPWPSARTAGRR